MSKAAELAALIGSQTALSNRNLIINGAMQVAQRGTSVSSLVTSSAYSTCDRWQVQYGSSGTFTESQSSTSPDGFSNSLKLDCTAEDASPDYVLILQRFEGQNLQNLQKGTSGAKSTTLSFYVRSSKTGTYQVNLLDNDNTRLIGATYTIGSANTWEYKTITFAGDTTGALDNDSSLSLQVEWWIASGSTYNSGAVPTDWEATAAGDRAAGLNVAIGASTSDDFHLAGVQLEVGEQATPFEHRSYGDELARCQRYYQSLNARLFNSEGYYNTSGYGIYAATALPVEMRSDPNITKPTPSANGNTGAITFSGYSSGILMSSVSSGAGSGYIYWSASTYVTADAEL